MKYIFNLMSGDDLVASTVEPLYHPKVWEYPPCDSNLCPLDQTLIEGSLIIIDIVIVSFLLTE